MKQYTLHIVLGVLALGLCVTILVLYNVINVSTPSLDVARYGSSIKKYSRLFDTWQDKMSKLVMKDYSPAVSEYYLSFPVSKYVENKRQRVFVLSLDKASFYSHFCLVQTMQNFKVPFKLTQNKAATQISIATDNKKLISNIVQKLNEYKIFVKIKEQWI